MRITRSQYQEAYRVGLDHHDGKIRIQAAKKRLERTGLNPNSAAYFIYNLSHLLKGECYKRALSEPATDDFLTWIRRDRGDEGPFANYTDELPLAWFAEEGTSRKNKHSVSGHRGGPWSAFCDVIVNGFVADLNYSPYPDENQKDGMLLGVTRIHFEDEDRSSIFKVEWNPHGSEVFTESKFKSPRFVVPPESVYVPPKKKVGESARQVRDRPGQVAFRRKLKSVYGNRCCLSGCSVTEALEGAHIDPYKAPASDNIRNGLLLRSDLHTLFDRHLIAIDPGTMRVHVSKRARGEAGYDEWHGVKIRMPDEPTHQPDQGALRRHWQNKHD